MELLLSKTALNIRTINEVIKAKELSIKYIKVTR